jgi:hypothetical protein
MVVAVVVGVDKGNDKDNNSSDIPQVTSQHHLQVCQTCCLMHHKLPKGPRLSMWPAGDIGGFQENVFTTTTSHVPTPSNYQGNQRIAVLLHSSAPLLLLLLEMVRYEM